VAFETALFQWEEGGRRLREAPQEDRRTLERVTTRIVEELRRRLGGPFSAQELADLYDEGTDWTLDVAMRAAPDNPRAWEAQVVADAAFLRYLREARDYAGGRLRSEER
jgi:hypothetical protein